ncbi:MAG: sensor histidine kinase [Desulfonatronovibrionaceae bacterium]
MRDMIKNLARKGGRGGYYQHLQRVFLFNSLLVPVVPMLLLAAVIIFEYDLRYSSLVHPVAVRSLDSADAYLARARLLSLGVMLAAVVFIVLRARSLSRRMAERIVRIDQEKQRLNEQMFQTAKLASIGELAAGTAHEINNPLAVILEEAGWMADLLEEEELKQTENSSEFARSLEQIRVQGQRCKEITRKLLSFARKQDSDAAEVRINSLLEDLLAVVQRRARKRGIRLNPSIQKDLPRVFISYSELQQVLFNLINNAFDAMDPEGGELDIRIYREKEEIVLEVEDTGVGIEPEQMERVFDPFYSTKPAGQGTGLGLSICYGLVRKWGGQIRASSTPGKGTLIRFTIPLSLADHASGRNGEDVRAESRNNEG